MYLRTRYCVLAACDNSRTSSYEPCEDVIGMLPIEDCVAFATDLAGALSWLSPKGNTSLNMSSGLRCE